MLHNVVVLVGVHPDVAVMGEGKVHNGGEDPMHVRQAGNPVNGVIRPLIVQPGAPVNGVVGGFRRGHEGEIAYHPGVFLQHIALLQVDIVPYDLR